MPKWLLCLLFSRCCDLTWLSGLANFLSFILPMLGFNQSRTFNSWLSLGVSFFKHLCAACGSLIANKSRSVSLLFLRIFKKLEVNQQNNIHGSLRSLMWRRFWWTSSPHHTFRMKQVRQCRERLQRVNLSTPLLIPSVLFCKTSFPKKRPSKKNF